MIYGLGSEHLTIVAQLQSQEGSCNSSIDTYIETFTGIQYMSSWRGGELTEVIFQMK